MALGRGKLIGVIGDEDTCVGQSVSKGNWEGGGGTAARMGYGAERCGYKMLGGWALLTEQTWKLNVWEVVSWENPIGNCRLEKGFKESNFIVILVHCNCDFPLIVPKLFDNIDFLQYLDPDPYSVSWYSFPVLRNWILSKKTGTFFICLKNQ